MIYLDNAATTQPFESVINRMQRFYAEEYYNPSALYTPAFRLKKEIDDARMILNRQLGSGGNLYFTSCATESNTWVFTSGIKNKKGNVVVSMGEHASVYENAQALIAKGTEVRYVKLDRNGTIDVNDFKRKLDENTTLVSVIHCSNETGAINDISALAKIAKEKAPKALFHSDGVQAFAKIPFKCTDAGIDLYSISAHKIGGPKGIGALWVRDGVRLAPLLIGGGQESGMRSGTENVAGIIGFSEALQTFLRIDNDKISTMRQMFITALFAVNNLIINESPLNSPFILSVSIPGIKAEILQRKLSENGILIGLGSACASRKKNNRVLAAMQRSMSYIEGSIRISFGVANLTCDLSAAIAKTVQCIKELQSAVK